MNESFFSVSSARIGTGGDCASVRWANLLFVGCEGKKSLRGLK